MKKIIIIIFFFILGFGAGRLPIIKLQNKLFMTKLKSITVIDGDTIHIVSHGNIEKVRLLDIDCHETSYNQRAEFQSNLYNLHLEEIYKKGEEEKIYLEKLLEQNKNNIYLKRQGVDKYGRTLGVLYIDKKFNLNQIMLENNICPPFIKR